MKRSAVGLALVIASFGMVGFECGEPRPPRPAARVASTLPGSCDGVVDYGDAFEISYLQIAAMRPVGLGVWEVEFDLEVTNRGNERFRSASVLPDFSAFPELGVVASPAPLPADFGAIDPHGTAWSTATLLLQLPATKFGDLMQMLRDGTVPLVVYGDEVNVLTPGVEIHDWSATEDRMYYLASQPSGGFGNPPNGDPGPGPFQPGQEFGVGFLEFVDDVPTVFDAFQPGDVFYLVENPDSPLGGVNENIPNVYDHVRVVDAVRTDSEDDGFTFWAVTLKRTDSESLPATYTTGSFCTDRQSLIDLPVHKSRLTSLDGDPLPVEVTDRNPQGIRFNDLPFANGLVKLSGQVEGHVLKPRLAFRIRDGQVSTQADFDTDLALTAELRAEDSAAFAPEDVELWSLCFPLPELSAGPISVSTNLQLVHTVGVEADVQAGAVVGFEKHFDSGFTIRCESGGGGGSSCSSEGRRSNTPVQFTPPRLTDDTAAHARVETTLEGSLNFFSPYPFCQLGPGLFLSTTAYGTLDVTPTQDPWWDMGYGLDVTAGVDLNVLGIDIGRYDTDLFSPTDDGPDSGVGGARSSGEDQRWAVAIDATAVPNGVTTTGIAALPDGSTLAIATEAIGGRNPIVKLDRHGAMQWVKNFGKKVLRIHALPDGTAIAAGDANAWIVRVDADGNLLWSFDAEIGRTDPTFARCSLRDVTAIEQSPGVYDYVGVGAMGTSLVTTTDVCAFRVRADGTLAWSRVYVGDRGQGFNGVTTTRDGNVVVVGSDSWSYVGNRVIPLFVKLDAATGDVIWWKGLPMTRLAYLNSVTEAADGTLFAVGNSQGIIYSTGAALVARIAPDGGDARHAFLFQDEDWEAALDFETWTDTAGGDTPYDTYFDIAPSGDGFVIAGKTGLGTATAARAAKINPELGIEWITTFDGADDDGLGGVAPAADGIFVSGYSVSLPQADGGAVAENQIWVMKLPFTGTLDFLPEVAMTTRFVAPAVRDSTHDPAVNPTPDVTIDNPYTVEDAIPISSGPNAALLGVAPAYCVELLTESGHSTTTDTCPDP